MRVGLFEQTYEGQDTFSTKETLFNGTAEDFGDWEYKPERKLRILLRLRLASVIPIEFIGKLLEDGTLVLKKVYANDTLYTEQNDCSYRKQGGNRNKEGIETRRE